MLRERIHLLGIILLVIGLPFSRAFVSISYVIIITNWLLDKNIFKKFGDFFKNSPALILTSIYFIHLLGLLYTSDFSYAWLEVRTKIPILILPLVFSTSKLIEKKEFIFIVIIFCLAVVASFGSAIYFFFAHSYIDTRDAFHFVSHIRLAQMAIIAVSIFLWVIFAKKINIQWWVKILFLILSLFLIWAIVILEVMSGLLIIIITLVVTSIFYLFKTPNINRLLSALIIAIVLISFSIYLAITIKNYNTPKDYAKNNGLTFYGNKYDNFISDYPIESGSFIGKDVCFSEMKQCWNQRSELAFDSIDMHGNPVKFTLLRFLNSKHLTKDFKGVWKLSKKEISFIEKGFANVEYTNKFSLKKRIYKLLWEYNIFKKENYIDESSAVKRLFLWETGLHLVAEKPWFGVGTGDVKNCFADELIKEKSSLSEDHLRAHNQFISIAIAFGIPGFLWFLFAIFYPFIKKHSYDFLFMIFFISYLSSMLWEDSLETQIGVTIFAFFYPFYLFMNPYLNKKLP
ncbi:MAG: hypothetical protein AUJ98_06000 [Bacteroidetes bacterium CG2_30_33_31]|nr:MAG: hypothetical protein AUJ98_06000 [Bacteroidetes bacterium CG2_30_33_31]